MIFFGGTNYNSEAAAVVLLLPTDLRDAAAEDALERVVEVPDAVPGVPHHAEQPSAVGG